jgi:hypothetical protein
MAPRGARPGCRRIESKRRQLILQMKTKSALVISFGVLIFLSSLVSALRGQDAEKEVRGMIKDALGGSKQTVAINDSNQKLQLRLEGKRCVVNGGSNHIRIDGECSELLVNGTGNEIRIEKVDAVRVLGANNVITYDRGVSSDKPENVRILGAGSSVVQAGSDRKNGNAPNNREPGRSEGSATAVTIAANNNSHLTRSIADQSSVILSGNNNSVEITGNASTLTISGNNNEVFIDGAGRVIFKGNNNEVSYKTGGYPQTTSSGLNNSVSHQEAP